jgi:hypothetical protein
MGFQQKETINNFYLLVLSLVRICCIGLVGLHHLFYKGAAGPLGLPAASLYAASPVAATPSGASPGVGPLGLQGRQPIRVQGVRHPWCRLPWPALGSLLPPINVTPHLSIEASNCTTIHL